MNRENLLSRNRELEEISKEMFGDGMILPGFAPGLAK